MKADFAPQFEVTPDDLAAALEVVAEKDAVAVPLLGARARAKLIEEAENLSFRQARPVIGEGDKAVRQEFEVRLDFPPAGAFSRLTTAIEKQLNAALAIAAPSYVEKPLRLNDLILQRYEPGCLGITPHRDHIKYTALVAIVVLCGDGRFRVCADRSGRGAVEIPAPAGHVLLMRAPGFERQGRRPFHFLDQVTERRYSFGLRQDSTLRTDG